MINLLDNKANQTPKCTTKNRTEINPNSNGTCSIYSSSKFKNLMLRPSFCDYSDCARTC